MRRHKHRMCLWGTPWTDLANLKYVKLNCFLNPISWYLPISDIMHWVRLKSQLGTIRTSAAVVLRAITEVNLFFVILIFFSKSRVVDMSRF